MMNFRCFALLAMIPLMSCSSSTTTPQSTDNQPAFVFTPISTLTVAPTIENPSVTPTFNLSADPVIGIDFVAELCNARWTSDGKDLPCPGRNLKNSPDGYVGLYDPALVNLKETSSAIITYPARNNLEGIFGRYPAYDVKAGDQFYTYVTCLPDAPCDVRFALDYYDGNGGYHNNFVGWNYRSGEPIKEVIIELSPLAGQRLEFVLALRPISNGESAYALWIAPRIIITALSQ